MDHYKDIVTDEQGLISVTEALRAMACGRVFNVQVKTFQIGRTWKSQILMRKT